MTDLDTITWEFGQSYTSADEWGRYKAQKQATMFEAFTEAVARGVLAQRLVPIGPPREPEINLHQHVERYFPGWRYIERRNDHILIEEDPAYLKYQYVNDKDRTVYARTVVESGPSLDDEALRADDPDLWDTITEWCEPWFSAIIEGVLTGMGVDYADGEHIQRAEQIAASIMKDRGFSKVLSDPNTWTEDQTERVNCYMYPGQVTTRLVAPRKATPEELGEV